MRGRGEGVIVLVKDACAVTRSRDCWWLVGASEVLSRIDEYSMRERLFVNGRERN